MWNWNWHKQLNWKFDNELILEMNQQTKLLATSSFVFLTLTISFCSALVIFMECMFCVTFLCNAINISQLYRILKSLGRQWCVKMIKVELDFERWNYAATQIEIEFGIMFSLNQIGIETYIKLAPKLKQQYRDCVTYALPAYRCTPAGRTLVITGPP